MNTSFTTSNAACATATAPASWPVLRTSVTCTGYLISDGVKIPDSGRLTYRSMNVVDIINGCRAEGRFGFEEVVWLLIFGKLPDERQYNRICQLLYENRELPEYFPEDVIMKNPSRDVMNKLARAVLTLYSYDDDPDDLSLENNMRQSISLIARMPGHHDVCLSGQAPPLR